MPIGRILSCVAGAKRCGVAVRHPGQAGITAVLQTVLTCSDAIEALMIFARQSSACKYNVVPSALRPRAPANSLLKLTCSQSVPILGRNINLDIMFW